MLKKKNQKTFKEWMLKFSKCFKMTHLKINFIYWKVNYFEVCNLMHDISFTKSWYIYPKNVPHAVYRNIHRYPKKGKILLIFHPWPAIYGIEQVNEKYLHEPRKRGHVINETIMGPRHRHYTLREDENEQRSFH